VLTHVDARLALLFERWGDVLLTVRKSSVNGDRERDLRG
jgi:hypothetical protein